MVSLGLNELMNTHQQWNVHSVVTLRKWTYKFMSHILVTFSLLAVLEVEEEMKNDMLLKRVEQK